MIVVVIVVAEHPLQGCFDMDVHLPFTDYCRYWLIPILGTDFLVLWATEDLKLCRFDVSNFDLETFTANLEWPEGNEQNGINEFYDGMEVLSNDKGEKESLGICPTVTARSGTAAKQYYSMIHGLEFPHSAQVCFATSAAEEKQLIIDLCCLYF